MAQLVEGGAEDEDEDEGEEDVEGEAEEKSGGDGAGGAEAEEDAADAERQRLAREARQASLRAAAAAVAAAAAAEEETPKVGPSKAALKRMKREEFLARVRAKVEQEKERKAQEEAQKMAADGERGEGGAVSLPADEESPFDDMWTIWTVLRRKVCEQIGLQEPRRTELVVRVPKEGGRPAGVLLQQWQRNKRIRVAGVQRDSAFAVAGLRVGDLLVSINQLGVGDDEGAGSPLSGTVADMEAAVALLRKASHVQMRVLRRV